MADNARPLPDLAVVDALADGDRLVAVLEGGAVRLSNVSSFASNSDVTIGTLVLANANSSSTPANSTIAVQQGKIWSDGTYIYVATANNTVKRAALSSF
jgi:hypothetical protein